MAVLFYHEIRKNMFWGVEYANVAVSGPKEFQG